MTAIARNVGLGDRTEVLALLTAAFDSPLEARLVSELWATDNIVAEALVEAGRQIVSYAAISPVQITGDQTDLGLGLAPVATLPEKQRQGYAALAVNRAMEAAFERYPNRLMFVLGDPDYYLRFGFTPAELMGYRWEGGSVGAAFQMRNATETIRPAPRRFAYGSEPEPRIVRYCDAFRVFDQEND